MLTQLDHIGQKGAHRTGLYVDTHHFTSSLELCRRRIPNHSNRVESAFQAPGQKRRGSFAKPPRILAVETTPASGPRRAPKNVILGAVNVLAGELPSETAYETLQAAIEAAAAKESGFKAAGAFT